MQVLVEAKEAMTGDFSAMIDEQRVTLGALDVPGGVNLIVEGRVYDIALHGTEAHYRGSKAAAVDTARSSEHLPASQSSRPRGGVQEYRAPMPGLIVNIAVKIGDTITEGQVLLIIEAMKMENELRALSSGTVKAVHVAAGDRVQPQAPLLSVS